MPDRIHDDEPDTSEAVVRALLATECPAWADLALTELRTSGTDNAMWRVDLDDGSAVVVRLPRRPDGADRVERETRLLRRMATSDLPRTVPIPNVRHVGSPQPAFPHPWSVLDWMPGVDAWDTRHDLAAHQHVLAIDLAQAVTAIGAVDTTALSVPPRQVGQRGGPLGPLLDRLDRWLDDPQWNAAGLVDLAATRRQADIAREFVDETVTSRFVHGDLIPGNLLVDDRRRLTAIIDWGGAARADPAQDLAPAWSTLDTQGRATFREVVGADDATWARARAFELEHAVGGIVYYVPRRHPLGDVMQRTLERILADPG